MFRALTAGIAGVACVCALSGQAFAGDMQDWKAGDFLVRGRALAVVPQEKSSLSVGGEVNVNNNVVPELDFTYFFTPEISAELIAAITKHKVKTKTGVDAGGAWLLPPSLTLQYHFIRCPMLKPYVGAGINYTHFFDEDAGALGRVKYKDSVGPVLQAGADIPINEKWVFNIDVKKVWMNTKADFFPSGVRADVDLDPWLIGVGVGYHF